MRRNLVAGAVMAALLLLIPLSTSSQTGVLEGKALGDPPTVEVVPPPFEFGTVSTAQSFT
jgi:hypothetical protein